MQKDGALVPPDPQDLAQREACYASKGIPLGSCFEIWGWYRAFVYAEQYAEGLLDST